MMVREENPKRLFIGGVPWEATEKDFKEYFAQFGELVEAKLKIDACTGKPRGFGFVTYSSESAIQNVMNRGEHYLLGERIDPKPAEARPASRKVFVGGLNPNTSEHTLRQFFSRFGQVQEIEHPKDRRKQQHKPFCFILFESEEAVDRALIDPKQIIDGAHVDIRKVTPNAIKGRVMESLQHGPMPPHGPGMRPSLYGMPPGPPGLLPGPPPRHGPPPPGAPFMMPPPPHQMLPPPGGMPPPPGAVPPGAPQMQHPGAAAAAGQPPAQAAAVGAGYPYMPQQPQPQQPAAAQQSAASGQAAGSQQPPGSASVVPASDASSGSQAGGNYYYAYVDPQTGATYYYCYPSASSANQSGAATGSAAVATAAMPTTANAAVATPAYAASAQQQPQAAAAAALGLAAAATPGYAATATGQQQIIGGQPPPPPPGSGAAGIPGVAAIPVGQYPSSVTSDPQYGKALKVESAPVSAYRYHPY